MSWRDKEYDAYTKTEQFRLKHGMLPHRDEFRKADGTIDHDAIKAMVDAEYPGVSAAPPVEPPPVAAKPPAAAAGAPAAKAPAPPPPPPPEEIIGRTADGKTMVQRADGSTYSRNPREGDAYAGPEITEPAGGIPVDTRLLQCP